MVKYRAFFLESCPNIISGAQKAYVTLTKLIEKIFWPNTEKSGHCCNCWTPDEPLTTLVILFQSLGLPHPTTNQALHCLTSNTDLIAVKASSLQQGCIM